MSSAFAKILVAALAVGVAQARPQMQPAPASSPAPAPPVDNTKLIQELELAPTAIDRFKKLFVGDDGMVIQGEALQKKVVFDFNNPAPAPNAKGSWIPCNET
jgi:hypothetical protein